MNKKIRGGVMIIAVIMLSTVLLGFTALAVDINNLLSVRRQLQNAADAAALSGAAYLFPRDSSGKPQWALAQSKALVNLALNKVDGVGLTNATFQTGYWDLTQATSGIKATTVTPGANDTAALKVTVSKSAGNNGGPVKLYFGAIFGLSTVDLSAQAIAVVGSPKAVPPGELFPMAMGKSLYESYWNFTTNKPKVDSSGNPTTFTITGSGSARGNWSSFNLNSNSASTISSLLTTGNTVPLKVGDNIWMAPGTKNSVYSKVPTNQDVLIPIVSNSSATGAQPIINFVAFHIISATGGSTKTISGYIIADYKSVATSVGGLYPGAQTSPRLVN